MILFAILFLGAFAEYFMKKGKGERVGDPFFLYPFPLLDKGLALKFVIIAFALIHIFILQTAPSGTLPSKIYPLRMGFTSVSDILEFISRCTKP